MEGALAALLEKSRWFQMHEITRRVNMRRANVRGEA